MAAFSEDSELEQHFNAFYQGRYEEVLNAFPSSISSSSSSAPKLQHLQLRSQLALGRSSEVLRTISSTPHPTPELQALAVLAHLHQNSPSTAEELRTSILATPSPSPTTALLLALSFAQDAQPDAALSLLAPHSQAIEPTALRIHIHLSRQRLDLATAELTAARSWANDSLLFNLAESWTGLRAGDRAHAQQAYYVFEELAGSIATLSAASLVGQAVAEVHLGRLPEAAQALEQALAMEGEGEGVRAGALVDRAVLDVLLAKGYEGSFGHLITSSSTDPITTSLQEKADLFDVAAAKYAAKVAG